MRPVFRTGSRTILSPEKLSTLRENLSIYLKKGQKGEIITITSRGHDMAKLVPVEDKRVKSREILRELGKTKN